ncbi:tRNA (guanine-N(7)-)-methyltransferase [Usitatibacter rugosus]|uniref:tRNA (guanine-N(7)-)-methyltransferase n=1 Tax=Usitatibacter rugosus TaxID=2732067 RepID=A0A6M4GNY4_9PROT|nr:tRNA (guanosine(46)-N7)-methyltransferase TrmB [Usitatibacter rugosus]QJR09049.1 tRNA (guanine-N(7)-)-methyltransferase [Usitatibacter rugosus]
MTHPPIRSYVLRQGRFSPAQQRAYEALLPRFGVAYRPDALDWPTVFGRAAPVVVEIGSGMGQATAEIAAAHPRTDYLAIEVHAPGVGSLLKMLEEGSLANVRVIQHDAVEVLRNMVPRDSLAGIHIFFPDPWPKKRHHKRRILQPEFAALLAERLAPGGYIHFATDWQEYAEQAHAVLSATQGLTPVSDERGTRPQTRFEQRGLRLGHAVTDMHFTKEKP